MLKFGNPEFLECSSRGDKRFSAFYARIRFRNNKTIEELYQRRKTFLIDGQMVSGLSIKEAKGRFPINMEDCKSFYTQLWSEYFQENPELYDVIRQYNGFTDVFGQAGHVCQASEIYRIRSQI